MNNAWILIALAVVLAAGGGYYFLSKSDDAGGMGRQEAANTESRKLTLKDLFVLGDDFQCTFAHDDGANRSSGTAYLAEGGDRIRADFEIEESAAGAMNGHLLRVGGYNYVWGSFYEQGIKVAVTEENKGELFSGDDEAAIDENTEFDCVPWMKNDSRFVVPSDVEFIDFSAAVSGQMNSSGAMNQCAACDMAPAGAARDQCKAALSCQ